MKKYKFLGFGLFIWFLAINSNALSNYIYTVNQSKDIQVCRIHESAGDIEYCVSSNFGMESSLSIIVSKDSHYAYVSTTENKIYICKIRNEDGSLTKCVLGTSKINFVKATAMAVTNSGDRFYVVNQGDNSILVCTVKGKVIDGCNFASKDYIDVSSIAISPDDKYAYFTLPKEHKIAVCQINKDRGRFGVCYTFEDPAYKQPSTISIDPTGKFAYITDNDDNIHAKHAVSCKVRHGYSLEECTSKDLSSHAPSKIIALDPTGKNIYLSFNSSIMKCEVNNGEYGMPCQVYFHKNYIYAVNKDGTIYVCAIQDDLGNIKNCTATNPDINGPLSITISKDYQYAYVSTKEDKIYSCKIDNDNGDLKSCSFSGNSFQLPVAMAFNHSGDKLFVLNQESSSISLCSVEDRKLTECASIANFKGMKPSSIAISPDDKHAYLTIPEERAIDVCQINSDGTRFTECTRLGNRYYNPHSIAIDPAGKFAYIADNDRDVSTGGTPGVSCQLIKSGSEFFGCRRQGLLFHRLPNNVALDSSGSYAYFSFSSTPSIMRCEIHSGEYQHCRVHYDSNFTGLISLSYR